MLALPAIATANMPRCSNMAQSSQSKTYPGIHKEFVRDRFKIEEKNYSTASRIIRETLDAELIKEDDPENKSNRLIKYVPIWS